MLLMQENIADWDTMDKGNQHGGLSSNTRAPIYYGEYLKLSEMLELQIPESRKIGREAHDETLFIIVHQVYELWFKQILHEIDSVIKIFNQNEIPEKLLFTAQRRLKRITSIQRLLIDQLTVMETMTPLDFLEFRDLLIPASGFQSVQFRELEVKMGLQTHNRENIDREYFLGRLNPKDRERIENAENIPSLLDLLEKWLERTPFLEQEGFVFWQKYQDVVFDALEKDREIIESNPTLTEINKEGQLENLNATIATFKSLFDKDLYEKTLKKGKRRLSQKAILGALFISLYRDEPILNLPFEILNLLIDIDEGFTAWRYRHALMAHRLLGTKIGTGGSSGHQYLKNAAEKNRVFIDLFDLSTFLIPKSQLPDLPKELLRKLDFSHSDNLT